MHEPQILDGRRRRGRRRMIDQRLRKALNRFSEIGGGAYTKIPENMIRAQSKIEALQDQLNNEKDEKIRELIKSRLALAIRELDSLTRGKA